MTRHSYPLGGAATLPAFDDDVWELYDGSKDWTQSHDLAKEMPEKLHELQRLWLIEAPSTTYCRSTTAASSVSMLIWLDVRSSSRATRNCCSAEWGG